MMKSDASSSTFRGFPKLPRGHHGILVDRCLTPGVARALDRFSQFVAVHLSEVYENDQWTQDVEFLAAAGDHGWGVATQNFDMRRTPPEMTAILEHGTRVFTLTTATLPDPGKGMIFGRHLISIRRRMTKPGPCFWRLYEERKTYDVS